ncbi:hypothetical protein [Neobacillus dielmonensis]|uniref:hypothetical protein n=1 Tax=Neobacillus dielmonensis TaxID=1347369 RepID=UPI0005A71542|nr:hypothetical protein [Neobacillus dielmonensis]
MVTLKVKLIILWSNDFLSKIKEAERKVLSYSKKLQEVCIICSNKQEESLCHSFVSNHIAVRTVLVNNEQPVYRQSDQLKVFLHSYIDENDEIFILLQKESAPIGHLLTQIGAAEYHEQVYFLTEDDRRASRLSFTTAEETNFDLIQHVSELIYSGNYQSASVLLNERLAAKHAEVNDLLHFGNKLFLLDFENEYVPGKQNPLNLLADTLTSTDISDNEEVNYLISLLPIQDQEQRPFIALLHNYAEFLYEQDDVIDFIVLYYRLVEETLLFALGWDHDKRGQFVYREDSNYKLVLPKWRLTKHYHRYNQALQEYIRMLEEKKQVRIQAGHQVGCEKLSDEEAYFVHLYLALREKGIVKCIEFRHEGISGHGFADLSKKELEILCGGKTPLEILNPLLERLGLKPEYSIFNLLNKGVLALLQEKVLESRT